jgi:hypothetical protein
MRVLCQVLEIYIASVHRGFGDFAEVAGLDRFGGGGEFAYLWETTVYIRSFVRNNPKEF